MYPLVPDFSGPLLAKFVYSNLLHEAPEKLSGTASVVELALEGNKYTTASNMHVKRVFLPRLSRSTLRYIYKEVAKGSLLNKERVSYLYTLGLGVPKSTILSSMWREIDYKGGIQLVDGTVFTFDELKKIFKTHLKEASARSFLYVYPTQTVNYYSDILKAVTPVASKRKPTDIVRISGSDADVILIYKCHQNVLHFNHAVLFKGNKFVDVTYQVMDNKQFVDKFDNTISASIEGRSVAIVGKFCFTDDYDGDTSLESLNAKVDELVSLDLDTFDSLVLGSLEINSANRRFTTRYRDKYYKAVNYLSKLSSTRKIAANQKANAAKAQALIDEVDKRRVAFRTERKNVRKRSKDSSASILQFVAYDILMVTGNATKPFKSGSYYRSVSAYYPSICNKLKPLGFAVMGKRRRSGPGKNLHRILVKGKAFWVEV